MLQCYGDKNEKEKSIQEFTEKRSDLYRSQQASHLSDDQPGFGLA